VLSRQAPRAAPKRERPMSRHCGTVSGRPRRVDVVAVLVDVRERRRLPFVLRDQAELRPRAVDAVVPHPDDPRSLQRIADVRERLADRREQRVDLLGSVDLRHAVSGVVRDLRERLVLLRVVEVRLPHLDDVADARLRERRLALDLEARPCAVDTIAGVDLSLVAEERRPERLRGLVVVAHHLEEAVVISRAPVRAVEGPQPLARRVDPGRLVEDVARLDLGRHDDALRDVTRLARDALEMQGGQAEVLRHRRAAPAALVAVRAADDRVIEVVADEAAGVVALGDLVLLAGGDPRVAGRAARRVAVDAAQARAQVHVRARAIVRAPLLPAGLGVAAQAASSRGCRATRSFNEPSRSNRRWS